jgi:hypothetical protein
MAAMSYALSGAAIDKLPAIMPSCYSADLALCRSGENPSYPHCAEIQQAEQEDEDAFLDITNPMPWCPGCYESAAVEKDKAKTTALLLGIAAGAVAGTLLGIAIF